MWKVLLSFVVFICAGGANAQTQNAAAILEKVASAYAGCRSYYDDASVTTDAQPEGLSQFEIRTTFVRPGGFRFILLPLNRSVALNRSVPGVARITWTALPSVVWTDGDQINKWIPNNPIR